ncbi:S1 family peptidase [Nocardia sp. NPDC057668]|uniref:S1 family peptidase n=1 Tax=Nocardia sp. NPDC057668 TaxID=3346202 RepID=UPI00366B8EB1
MPLRNTAGYRRAIPWAGCVAVAAIALAPCTPASAIAGGHPAAAGEVHSVVQITGALSPCNGTILTPRAVLTAAHCLIGVERPTNLGILYGSTDTGAGTPIEVSDAAVNEGFNPMLGLGDIAVLTLAEPIVFGPTAQPADLPPQGQDPAIGDFAVIAGWGATEPNGSQSPTLQVGTALIIPRAHCLVPAAVLGLLGDIVCISGAGTARPCIGDSGGPMLYTPPGAPRPQVVGVTSNGMPCGHEFTTHAAYTRVGHFSTWIQDHLPD